MIWIAVFLLLSSSAFYPYLFMKKPSSPSPGSLGYLDLAFVDWTSRLVHKGLLDADHWLLKCPGYLRGCCPSINPLDADQEVLNQLTDMTPVHAFAYVLVRRFAEVVVRLSSCWLLVSLFVVLIFSTWRTWQASSREMVYGRSAKAPKPTWWNPKNVSLLLSAVLLSIVVPTLAEEALGGVVDYQLRKMNGNASSFSILRPWKVQRPEHPVSVLHLFDFVRLHQFLYDRWTHPSAHTLCRQMALSLSYWSVLVFVGAVYTLVTVVFRGLIWRPVKSLFSGLATDKASQNRAINDCRSLVQASRDSLFKTYSKKMDSRRSYSAVPISDPKVLFSEKSDFSVVEKSSEIQRAPSGQQFPVRPRYVSRGVYACMDSMSDEYALRD